VHPDRVCVCRGGLVLEIEGRDAVVEREEQVASIAAHVCFEACEGALRGNDLVDSIHDRLHGLGAVNSEKGFFTVNSESAWDSILYSVEERGSCSSPIAPLAPSNV